MSNRQRRPSRAHSGVNVCFLPPCTTALYLKVDTRRPSHASLDITPVPSVITTTHPHVRRHSRGPRGASGASARTPRQSLRPTPEVQSTHPPAPSSAVICAAPLDPRRRLDSQSQLGRVSELGCLPVLSALSGGSAWRLERAGHQRMRR